MSMTVGGTSLVLVGLPWVLELDFTQISALALGWCAVQRAAFRRRVLHNLELRPAAGRSRSHGDLPEPGSGPPPPPPLGTYSGVFNSGRSNLPWCNMPAQL